MMATELFICASSPNAAIRYLPKRYTFRGEIGLTYEKKWTEQRDTDSDSERFTHKYGLGLSGFVIDPRLMTFDIDTAFSQEKYRPGDDSDSYGFDTSLSMLNKPARRGFFSHFPRPIELTFSTYETGNSRSSSYGISLGYDLFEKVRIHRQFQQQQQQQQFRRQQQIMQQNRENNNSQQSQGSGQGQINTKMKKKIFPLLLPIMYADYNNYSYSSVDSSRSIEVDSEFLDIRLVDRNYKTDFQSEYIYKKTEGVTKSESHYLITEANYRNYLKEKKERIESFNRLDLRDIDTRKALELSSRNTWSKSLGKNLKDKLAISGGGSYFNSNDLATPENYKLVARSEYTKNFIKMWNRSSADLNYGDSGVDEIYFARFSNETNYDLSKRHSLNGRLSVGRNELGELYGAGAGIWVQTFIRIMPRYDFTRVAASEGKTTNNDFSLDLDGRIAKNLTFNSRNFYIIREVSGSAPFKEKALNLRADFFWTLSFMNINLGATRVETKKNERDARISGSGLGVVSTGEEVDLEVTSIYANLSTPLSRSAFLNFRASYTEDREKETFEINPIITWHRRRISLTAEYEFRKISGETDRTDHRIYMRLTRSFAGRLRKFW